MAQSQTTNTPASLSIQPNPGAQTPAGDIPSTPAAAMQSPIQNNQQHAPTQRQQNSSVFSFTLVQKGALFLIAILIVLIAIIITLSAHH
jgi:hypothetical protein